MGVCLMGADLIAEDGRNMLACLENWIKRAGG